jgi:hypothetical protein
MHGRVQSEGGGWGPLEEDKSTWLEISTAHNAQSKMKWLTYRDLAAKSLAIRHECSQLDFAVEPPKNLY